ncbi:hypothetical protein DEO72_LG11g1869 [Vigna unguiculata]|uniref:Uncharacterized protein n=1 Tax=Vigna unguiculata TaxID=3917 RepID=A0A4D6NM21_VIGUN|nr:hypothetical protein DEO72_LG11g1869 [Vigna unguiculata]
MNGDSPRTFARKVAQATSSAFLASEHLAQARGVSPKQDPVCVSASFFESSPRRRGLAWARSSRLSETLQPERGAEREGAMLDCFVALG